MKLTNQQRAAITRDPRKLRLIAADYGIGHQYVSLLKRQAGLRREPAHIVAVATKGTLPDRHYRPAWDAQP